MNQAAIALFAVTLATFFNSLGYIFFKFAHLRIEKNQGKGNYLFTWQFIVGFIVIAVGAAVNVGKLDSSLSLAILSALISL
jgi:hypothetical protein